MTAPAGRGGGPVGHGTGPVAHIQVGVLGLLTIAAYGTWFYSFGVLLDPIIDDTGWREGTLAASFSVGMLGVGLGSVVGGRLIDRIGTAPVFLAGALLGGGALLVASAADDVWLFGAGAAMHLAVTGAFGQYHVTMTAAVRSSPAAPARAIALLTIYGAFASAIYLPIAAWLVDDHGWRTTTRVMAVSGSAAFVLAALLVRIPPEPTGSELPPRLRAVARRTLGDPDTRSFTVAVALAGVAASTLLVYQVPLMVAAGLPLGTAATVAAARGFLQLTGRVPLSPMVATLGAPRSLIVALTAIAVSSLVLLFAGTVAVAAIFAVVAGFGMGAYSPLQGIVSEELFDRATLGTTMGFMAAVHMLAAAVGPVLAGTVADLTGDREWAVAIAFGAAAGGAVVMWRGVRSPAAREFLRISRSSSL